MASRHLKNEKSFMSPASDKAPSSVKEIGPMSKVRNFKGPSIKGSNCGPTDTPYYDDTTPSQSSGKDSDPTTSR
jgi:hypothetical protein